MKIRGYTLKEKQAQSNRDKLDAGRREMLSRVSVPPAPLQPANPPERKAASLNDVQSMVESAMNRMK